MPAKSEDQRRAAAIAYKIKTGQRDKKGASKPAKQMAESMSTKQLKHYMGKKK